MLLGHQIAQAKDVDEWDLGDICLAQCEDSIPRVTASSQDDNSSMVVDPKAPDGDIEISNRDSQVWCPETDSYNLFKGQESLWADF